jgi:hypothetical protein
MDLLCYYSSDQWLRFLNGGITPSKSSGAWRLLKEEGKINVSCSWDLLHSLKKGVFREPCSFLPEERVPPRLFGLLFNISKLNKSLSVAISCHQISLSDIKNAGTAGQVKIYPCQAILKNEFNFPLKETTK